MYNQFLQKLTLLEALAHLRSLVHQPRAVDEIELVLGRWQRHLLHTTGQFDRGRAPETGQSDGTLGSNDLRLVGQLDERVGVDGGGAVVAVGKSRRHGYVDAVGVHVAGSLDGRGLLVIVNQGGQLDYVDAEVEDRAAAEFLLAGMGSLV